MVIGTDGIWEALGRRGDRYGMQRLRDVIRKNAISDAAAIIDAVYDDIQRFTYGVKQEDDISLVIVKAQPEALPQGDWSI